MRTSGRSIPKLITRITLITVIIIGVLLSILAALFNYYENNPLSFIAGTRIHNVRPLVYDDRFNSGTLVLVRPADIGSLREGDIISMVYNNEAPFMFNNERFISFEEEFYGLSLHGIVTERTVVRERSPLRGGHFVGVPYGAIPLMGALIMWIAHNLVTYYIIAFSVLALAILAFALVRKEDNSRKALLPKKRKRR